MTNSEKKILKIIKENPMISQQELANKLNLQRSSIAVHILNLKQKGKILGKGYILPNEEYVTVIGGANVDFIGYSRDCIVKNDSNIGYIKTSLGGVGRNIAENLAKLDVKTYLITAVGTDDKAKLILENAINSNIDTSKFIVVNEKNIRTSSYMAILDDNKDMLYAISDMEIMNYLDEFELDKRKNIIDNSKYIVVDLNITDKSLNYIFNNFSKRKNIIVDTVSKNKTSKILNYLDKIFLIKPNVYELEILANMKILNVDDIHIAASKIIEYGVEHLIVSRGEQGIEYFSKNIHIHFDVPKVKVMNATGAGDSFLSGITYGLMNDLDIYECILYGIGAANITLESENTVSEKMTLNNLNNEKEKLGGILC